MLLCLMAMRKFQVLDTPNALATDPPDAQRQRAKALIGGSIEKRRAHGTPSPLKGRYVVDPIFRVEDEDRLRAYCDPTDKRRLVVEIGFQLGRFVAGYCALHPDDRFLGFEVRRKFCEEADVWLQQHGVENAVLALVDAREMLPRVLVPGTLDELFVFFPDPWWKLRHIKKRLISPEFVADAAGWLRDGGRLLLKSDVSDYADWAEEEFRRQPAFEVTRLQDPSAGLPPTLRERRCGLRGEPTWAVQAIRRPRIEHP
jgi:tRNA (guanine-N(7)-)-methyltransferase